MINIVVTGGAGFIGSNFIFYMLEKYDDYRIINIDNLSYAGSLNNLNGIEKYGNRYLFKKTDICDLNSLEELFDLFEIQGVVHFAAESHVDNSISGPDIFIKTNILGTFNLLETTRKKWMKSPFEFNESYRNAKFLHISTDEVYGTLGETGYFTEQTPYAPNSPYSASKASSDFLVRSYFHTFGLNVLTTNCSNNYGPKQHSEKLIPTIIRKALALEPIPIYGDGKNIRDWLYVEDHCVGIDLVFHKGEYGETYNIGGRNEHTNIEIATIIAEIIDQKKPRKDGKSYKELISFVTDRPGHDRRYAIDNSKIFSKLGWESKTSFIEGLHKTVNWYLKNSNVKN